MNFGTVSSNTEQEKKKAELKKSFLTPSYHKSNISPH